MSNEKIDLDNGTSVTKKQVATMVAIFNNASRDLLKTVDWTAVSIEAGYASRSSARDAFTRRCDRVGWLQGGVTILPVAGASGASGAAAAAAAPPPGPPAAVPAVAPAINPVPATVPTTAPAVAPAAPVPVPAPYPTVPVPAVPALPAPATSATPTTPTAPAAPAAPASLASALPSGHIRGMLHRLRQGRVSKSSSSRP